MEKRFNAGAGIPMNSFRMHVYDVDHTFRHPLSRSHIFSSSPVTQVSRDRLSSIYLTHDLSEMLTVHLVIYRTLETFNDKMIEWTRT